MSTGNNHPVDNFGTVVGENPDCLLLSGTVVGENPDHVCWATIKSVEWSGADPGFFVGGGRTSNGPRGPHMAPNLVLQLGILVLWAPFLSSWARFWARISTIHE